MNVTSRIFSSVVLQMSRKLENCFEELFQPWKSKTDVEICPIKALRYNLFFVKALTKRLWKLAIITKRLIVINH